MAFKIKDIVIAFDGHSSCGKSTVAKEVSKKLGYTYVDSGAMYRMITLFAMQEKLINGANIDTEKLKERLKDITVAFKQNNSGGQDSYLNGKNVESLIRSIEVSDKVSYISELDFVRTKLVELQQDMGKQKRIVMDGRDIGTIVFPNAELKIFMTASAKVRAQRRYDELISKGHKVSFEEVLENIEKRDFIDQNREISPLKKAHDAIVLDNSDLSREEQLEWVIKLIEKKFAI